MRRFPLIFSSSLFAGVLLAIAAVSAGSARTSHTEPASNSLPLQPVQVATVHRGTLAHPIRTTGVLRAKNQLDLGFLVGGQVTWVGVDVGSSVRRGQSLARLDTTQYAADAERARANEVKARRDLTRVAALESSGALPQATLDDAETGHAVADAQHRSAEFALRHGVLLAPDDGVIDARLVDPGEVVSPGQPTLRLSSRTRGAVVQAHLVDRDVIGLELGRVASIRLDAAPDVVLGARVSQIATTATPTSGEFEVELRLDAIPAGFKTGMTAKVEIQRTEVVGAIVPIAALAPGEVSGTSIVSIEAGTAHRIPVRPLFFEGAEVALADRLPNVTHVAVAGALGINDGTHVKAVEP